MPDLSFTKPLLPAIYEITSSPTERQEFTKFILESIGRVFTSPTEKIFDPKEKEKIKLEKFLKYVAEIMGSAAKAAKP